MTLNRPRRSTYEEFTQRVRRHKPSELLPALARTAIEFGDKDLWLKERIRLPWAIAAAAKVSVVSGNEHRTSGVTDRDILEICSAYNNLDAPFAPKSGQPTESFLAFMVRLNHEQFGYQTNEFPEMCRLATLFENMDELKLEILSAQFLTELLECTVNEFFGAGLVIALGAKLHQGFFDPKWESLWEGPGSVHQTFSMEKVDQVFQRHFVSRIEDFKELAEFSKQSTPNLRQLEFNPLVGRPFIALPDGRYLAPQFQLAFQKISPTTVYYAGVEKLQKKELDQFTRDMGVIFQDYVGRQLRLLDGAVVCEEIEYKKGQLSVDWFVIFPEVVILVEAKSTRLSQLARMGGHRLKDDLDRCIGDAFDQITGTEEKIHAKLPAFDFIPKDRKRIALVVTLEPYWSANAAHIDGFLKRPEIPTMVTSIRTLEHLIGVIQHLGSPEFLVAIMDDADRRTWDLGSALPKIEVPANPILEEAWKKFPFMDLGEYASNGMT